VPPYSPDGHYHGTSAAPNRGPTEVETSSCSARAVRRRDGAARCPPVAGRRFHRRLMSIAEPARQRAWRCRDRLTTGGRREFETIKVSLGNLMTFPWIRERVAGGRLALHGWYFDLAHGSLRRLDPVTQEFRDV
jgi:carbonic anhydrase